MNLYSIDYYRKIVEAALSDTGAFVRVSRAEGLFVTDAERRGVSIDALKEKLTGFSLSEKDGMIYIMPLTDVSDEADRIYSEILKAETKKKEKLIRIHLAEAMRLKDSKHIEMYQFLYERMIAK